MSNKMPPAPSAPAVSVEQPVVAVEQSIVAVEQPVVAVEQPTIPVADIPPAVQPPVMPSAVHFSADEKVPANWSITAQGHGIYAHNSVTRKTFAGTIEAFNALLRD